MRYKVLWGGRGSGKSYAVADSLLIIGKQRRIRVLCAREFQNSIKESVHQLLSDRIEDLGFDRFYRVTRDSITGENGTLFIFKGVHANVQSIKSLQGLTHLWIEEGQSISAESWRVLTPTVRAKDSEIWITMNPDSENDPIYYEFIANQRKNAWVEEVNWNRNPYFTEALNEERLEMKRLYPAEVYEHVWEGKIKTESDEWQVIPSAWVQLAMDRWESCKPIGSVTAIGVDVARGGKDETILAPRIEYWFDALIVYPGSATPDGSMVAAQVSKHLPVDAYANIDVVGVGSSVYDALKGSVEVYGVSGGEKAIDSWGKPYTDKTEQFEFKNTRSWMIWRMRELLDPDSGLNICLPPDPKLKADLCAPRWKITPPIASSKAKGQIYVESKDDIKKRLGRSPDRGDAVCYAAIDREHFTPKTSNLDRLALLT